MSTKPAANVVEQKEKKPEDLFELSFTTDQKVHIKKIVHQSAQGRHKHTTKEGVLLNKSQAGKAGTTWVIPALTKSSKLNTGLWKKRSNPYYKSEDGESVLELPADYEGKSIEKAKYITWQMFFEISHHKPLGFYSSEAQPFKLSNPKTYTPSAIQTFKYLLNDGTTTLDLSNERDQLMYFFALHNKNKFASGIREVGLNPRNNFYISAINEPEEAKAERNKIFEDAIYNLVSVKRQHSEQIVKRLAIVMKVVRGEVSYDAACNALNTHITEKFGDENSPKLRERCEQFNTLVDLLNDKKEGGKKRLNTLYVLQLAINRGIVGETTGTYRWHSHSNTEVEIIGRNKEQAIHFLEDPEKEIYRKELVQEIGIDL